MGTEGVFIEWGEEDMEKWGMGGGISGGGGWGERGSEGDSLASS